MKREERAALLYRVARLHYEEGLKKNAIAQVIHQSPTQVTNLLREAKRKGIVRIEIELPKLQVLQDRLKREFNLHEAIVIPYEADLPALLRQLGRAGADYFDTNVKDGMSVALGGGYLMYEMVSELPDRIRDIQIFPAAIMGRGPVISHIDPMTLVSLLWARSGRLNEHAHYVTVTPLDKAGSRSEVAKHYKRLLQKAKVQSLFEAAQSVEWVFASIGGLNPDESYVKATQFVTRNLFHEMKFEEAELNELKNAGVVGDIIYSFFDARGNANISWSVIPSLGIPHLKNMSMDSQKRVVVIVGSYKMQALKAVLLGKLCNVLITDARAAETLLKR
jgi:deoxyribonucleoside regulator